MIAFWPLWLHETIHFSLCTLAAFLVWRFVAKRGVKFWKLWLTALTSGFFIDGDHLFDHFFAYGVMGFFNHGVLSFFDASIANPFLEAQKAYVIFHGWEYLIAGSLVLFFGVKWGKGVKGMRSFFSDKKFVAVCLVFLLSYFFHLCFDQLSWSHSGWGYFLTYRLLNNFSLLKL